MLTTRKPAIVRVAAASFGLMACLVHPEVAPAATSQPYVWRNVQIVGGGFVPGIIFNQTEPNLIYARTDIGGAYRWNQGTQSWIPLTDWIGFDDWNLTGIVSLATDPVDPNRVYLAAGTYTNDWTSQNGAILRSADRGVTWQRSDLPFKLGGNMPGRGMGERLVVDPNSNNILYLGAPSGHGLWRSTDFGATWSKVNSFPTGGTYAEDPADPNGYLTDIQGVVWVTFDPRTGSAGNTTQTIYVGVADLGPCIYRSTDGGATWSSLPGHPTGFVPHKGVLDDANGYLFVATSNNGGPYGGTSGDVWRYDTAVGTWTLISPYPSTDTNNNFFGYSGLTVDRQNPSTIMVTGYSSWWPDTQIWRSTNSGTTWSRIWDWTRYPKRSFRYTQDISAAPWLYWGGASAGGRPGAEVFPKLGWMTESLEIDPHNSDRMMYGTGATIYGSENLTVWDQSTTSQITIKVMAQGLEETAIQELVSPPAGPPLISGMYDINGFTHTDLEVVPTAFFENPRIATIAIDYAALSPNIIFRAGDGDSASMIKSAGYSTNGGLTWTPVGNEPAGTTNGGTIAVSANGTRVVWSPDGAGVHYTSNSGSAWTASSGIPAGAQVRSDRVNANKFYGFNAGVFYVSTNGGASFSATVTSGLPSAAQFKAATAHEGHLWLASGVNGLWRSVDSGASFTRLATIQESEVVGFGQAASGETYPALYTSGMVDNVRGIYRSTDAGTTWVRVNDDQHQYGWTGKAITGDPRVYGRVYLATNGRGIIYGDLATSTSPPAAPSNLSAATVSASAIDLSWTDHSSDETAFEIDRATNSTFTAGLVTDMVGPNSTAFQSSGLAANTTYFFRVRALNSAGPSANSNTASAMTQPPGLATASHVESITVSTVGAGQGKKRGQATVIVRDNLGAVVPNAIVAGAFTGSINESVSASTNSNGAATLTTNATAGGNVTVTFCVSGITHATLSYDAAANVETCDSN